MWEAIAEYANGIRIEKYFPYYENGDYEAECKRQYELETYLIGLYDNCIYYSVANVKE